MKRVAHISDLHFGKADQSLLTPLIEAVNDAQPDLVAVTGDFTQRARHSQYRDACVFLDRLNAPWIGVPGNHDVSLDNLWLRFFRPWQRYRRFIRDDLFPIHQEPGLCVVGLNTVDRFRWQRGKVRWLQMQMACRTFSKSDGFNIVLAHHPFEQGPDVDKALMKDAERAIERLSECGANLVLTGHLHRWRAEPFLSEKHGRQVLQVHVGTGLSTRLRGQDNDFAIIDLTPGKGVCIHRYIARGKRFEPDERREFLLSEIGWTETPVAQL